MRRLLQVVLVCLCAPAWAQDPVYFADPKLQEVVEETLVFVWNPTPEDMLYLTKLRYFEQAETLSSLVGLEYAANLQELRLRHNEIGDLSPLSGLLNLDYVDLSRNQFSDLSPLSGLTSLRYLNIHGNELSDISALSTLEGLDALILRFNAISDVSALSSLTHLKELDLGSNQISDISPLASMVELTALRLWDNQVDDISALAGMTQLEQLNINDNLVSDVSPLAGMESLYDLDLSGNAISDVNALCDLTNLASLDLRGNPLTSEAYRLQIPRIIANNPTIFIQHDDSAGVTLSVSSTVGGSAVAPGEGYFSYVQPGTVIRLEAAAEPGFVFVAWAGDIESTENPAFLAVDGELRVRAIFQSTLESLCVDDDSRADPGPADVRVSDPDEDGTTAHPFDSIQEAIDVAAEGATIYVYPGLYRETIDFAGKSIFVLGIDPNHEAAMGPQATIAGVDPGPVVCFSAGEGSESTLAGFIITQGQGESTGAILCEGANPRIINCLIVGNRAVATEGAVIRCRNSSAVLVNCTVADNVTGDDGAVLKLIDSDIVAVGSIIWGNTAGEVFSPETNALNVRYCNLESGKPDAGTIDADPLFARRGSWVSSSDPDELVDPTEPLATWSAGDYHLMSQTGRWNRAEGRWIQDDRTSPCIDAGAPEEAFEWEPQPNGGRANMGAYANTGEASKSLTDLSK